MNKSTVWTIVGVIAAILIAWFLVERAVLGGRLHREALVVAVVAVIVFFVLRMIFARGDDSES